MMGLGAFIFPILIIFIGFCYIVKKNKINFSKKFYGIVLFIINTLLFIQMVVMPNYYINDNVTLGMRKLYEIDGILHGGIISFLIDVPLFKLFGNIGCYVIFISLYIISCILMSRVTLYDVLHKIKYALKENDVEEDEAIIEDKNDKKVIILKMILKKKVLLKTLIIELKY